MLFLVFRLGRDRYAIEATQVVEVLPHVNFKRLPRAPAGVAGVLDYHGAPVPLLDLAELALGRRSRTWMSTRVILVNYCEDLSEGHLLGVLAEQATETLRRAESDFAEPGVAVADSPYLGPVTTDKVGMIQRVEIKKLLSESIRNQLFPEGWTQRNGRS